jgi:bacterioferritin (cytochrome b1)
MSKRLDDPQYWRDRAEEARTHAEEMKDPETRHIMLKIAEGHERQAQILEKKKAADSQNRS